MYKTITRFADNNSDEIILNKAKNGLLKYTLIAHNRNLILDFLLTDEQILLLVSQKVPIIFEGNKRRIHISQIIQNECSQYFHFAYLNDIFVQKDSEEIKEALKDIFIDYYLCDNRITIENVFRVRNKVMIFNPKIIQNIYAYYKMDTIGDINLYPDGSMKVYEFLQGKYDKYIIKLHTSYGTPEESAEIKKIQESYEFFNPSEPIIIHRINSYDADDIFDKKFHDKMQRSISLLPNLPSSRMYNSILEYLERIKVGLYSSKHPADISFSFQN